jgi:hypothetical protein
MSELVDILAALRLRFPHPDGAGIEDDRERLWVKLVDGREAYMPFYRLESPYTIDDLAAEFEAMLEEPDNDKQ